MNSKLLIDARLLHLTALYGTSSISRGSSLLMHTSGASLNQCSARKSRPILWLGRRWRRIISGDVRHITVEHDVLVQDKTWETHGHYRFKESCSEKKACFSSLPAKYLGPRYSGNSLYLSSLEGMSRSTLILSGHKIRALKRGKPGY